MPTYRRRVAAMLLGGLGIALANSQAERRFAVPLAAALERELAASWSGGRASSAARAGEPAAW